jgi:hypothetical protein
MYGHHIASDSLEVSIFMPGHSEIRMLEEWVEISFSFGSVEGRDQDDAKRSKRSNRDSLYTMVNER